MAYNNGFPMNYPQYQQYIPQISQPMPQTQAPAQAQSNSIIWVQGEAGAKSYLVAPNNTVQLWDSEAQTIYLKSADASGMPSMKILDYTIRDANPATTSVLMTESHTDYVTKDELSAFEKKVMQMIKEGNNDGESAF